MAKLNKVLVTGGSGFIGSYVVDRLLDDGVSVVVFDHTSPGSMAELEDRDDEYLHRVEIFLGDIRDEVAVTEAMAHVDGFIHLAGVLGTSETIGNPKPAIMTNVTGGLNILEAAVQYDLPGVNIAVGNHWENNPYSISKSTVERLAQMYVTERGARVSSVRALNAYGPRQSVAAPYGHSKVRKVVPSFVMRALHGDPIEIFGTGDQIMDMIYVGDVADFLVDALYSTAQYGPFSEVIEAGTGLDTTVRDVAIEVRNHVQDLVDHSIEISYQPRRPGETLNAVVKADPSTHELLYPHGKNLVSLSEGIRRTVGYYHSLVS